MRTLSPPSPARSTCWCPRRTRISRTPPRCAASRARPMPWCCRPRRSRWPRSSATAMPTTFPSPRAAAGAASPRAPSGPEQGFAVIAEADGTVAEAEAGREALREAMDGAGARRIVEPEGEAAAALWRWRDGVSLRVAAKRGGKLSEDIAVPLDRLAEAIQGTLEIGGRHDVEALSWGHAGDGNLHSSFLVAPGNDAEHARAERACEELFELALSLGGTITGEHGVGRVKRAYLERQLGSAARLNTEIKRAFDPKGLLNPGVKVCLGE